MKTSRTAFVLRLAVFLSLFTLLTRSSILWFTPNWNASFEGNALYGVLEWAAGRPLYPSFSAPPFGIYLYPPVHAWFVGAVARWSTNPVGMARTLSLLAGIFSLVLFYRRIFRGRWEIFIVCLVLGASRYFDYLTTARNDTLALAWEVGSWIAFVAALKNSRWAFFLALSLLSLWTRQTGIAVFVTALLWLIREQRYRVAAGLLTSYLLASLGLVWVMGPHFLEHVFFANLREFRPLWRELSEPSFIAFGLAHLYFVRLLMRGLRRPLNETEKRLRLLVTVSGTLGLLFFLREGGDVNYFFETLLFGTYFVGKELETLRPRFLVAPLVVVAAIGVIRAQAAFETSRFPFRETADRIRQELPGYGLLAGRYSQAMAIYLRGWALHGPDVTDAGKLALRGHHSLRVIYGETLNLIKSGKVRSLVVVDPQCADPRLEVGSPWAERFAEVERWGEGVCVYRVPRTRHTSHAE